MNSVVSFKNNIPGIFLIQHPEQLNNLNINKFDNGICWRGNLILNIYDHGTR